MLVGKELMRDKLGEEIRGKGKEKSLSRIPFLYREQNKESMMYETVIHYVTTVLALAGTMLQLKLQLVNKLHPLFFFNWISWLFFNFLFEKKLVL